MLDSRFLRWRRWPNLLQRSAIGCLSVLLLALVYVLLAGPPQPIAPASSLFAPVSVERVLAVSRPAPSSADFSLRPVFAIKRVPPPQPVIDETEELSVEVAPTSEIVGSIDGVRLLGIFGSGEVAGAIIRLDNGERQRLPVGELVNGWALQSLEQRGALFQAATGQRALLKMAFSTNQSSKAAQPSGGAAAAVQPSGGAAVDEEPPQYGTFGNIYRNRERARDRGEK